MLLSPAKFEASLQDAQMDDGIARPTIEIVGWKLNRPAGTQGKLVACPVAASKLLAQHSPSAEKIEPQISQMGTDERQNFISNPLSSSAPLATSYTKAQP
jgi:hypothetical protein